MKWGALYRAGHLANLTPRGVKRVEDLGLSKIIDFRSKSEVERHPDQDIQGPEKIYLPVLDQATKEISQEITRRINNKEYGGFQLGLLMEAAYRTFADQYTPVFRSFIHTVLEADGAPILWHCTSGKDRTGFSSAIILRILGVDLEIICQDYLLSNRYGDKKLDMVARIILARGFKAYRLVRPIMGVNESWLRAAFDAVDEHWGDFDSYLKDGLDLDLIRINSLKKALLEE